MKHIIYIFSFLLSTLAIAQNETLFQQGNAHYNDGDYSEAITKYRAILDSGSHSAELYFNLGNAYYKLNTIAPSIYYYEKALQLAPNDKDILNNIAFARNMTIDAISPVPEVGFSKLIKNVTNILSFDDWAKAAVGSVMLFVLLFLSYYFSYSTGKKRLAFISSFVVIIMACVALSLAYHKYNLEQNDKPAIVFAKETQIKNEPNLRSAEAFKLHEGTKVQVLDTVDNWKKIKIADGKTGWVLSEDIKLLKNI
jgi:tetratricopeptide (TPR) repeat protein